MDEIAKKIENAKKQPLTVENLNYIGDLYLKKGDKTTAIAYFYELAEKLHISQKDKKLAIYKKIINISTSESQAYEKIINIFSRMGLAAEEKKYIMMLANLYQNKGEMNKLDALHRRITEIDPEYHGTGTYLAKGKQDDFRSVHEDIIEKKKDILPLADDVSDESLSGNKDRDKEEPGISIEHPDELHKRLENNTVEGRRNEGPVFHEVGFIPGLRNYFKYIALCFLLILLGFSIYLYQGKSVRQRNLAGTGEIAVQTGNFEIHVKKLTDIKELEGRISESDRNRKLFLFLINKGKDILHR